MTSEERKRDEGETVREILEMLTKDHDKDEQKVLAHLALNFLAILIEELDPRTLMPNPYASRDPYVSQRVLIQWGEVIEMVDVVCGEDKRKFKRILALVCKEVCMLALVPLCRPLDDETSAPT